MQEPISQNELFVKNANNFELECTVPMHGRKIIKSTYSQSLRALLMRSVFIDLQRLIIIMNVR